MSSPEPQNNIDTLAAIYKAVADPIRLNILKVLQRNSFGVLELCKILDHKQSALSHHLKVLSNSGLLETRREGNSIFYRRGNAAEEIQANIFASADALNLDQVTTIRLNAALETRQNLARQFFDKVDSQFNEHQERIADSSTYNQATLTLLDGYHNDKFQQSVLEIGPGEGALLNQLTSRFKNVCAVDISSEMLSRAKENTQNSSIRFVQGDINHSAFTDEHFDSIVTAMVLHHIPAPATLFQQMANKLKPGGTVTVTDLCPHDQQWAQSLCGDLWMGFDSKEMEDWASNAGLIENNSMYLAQKNGFQIQARQFLKPL